jgi:energy-coupling factor transport system ATP-binding protein
LGALLPDVRHDRPAGSRRRDVGLGRGHRGRRVGGAPPGAQASRRARRVPRLTAASLRAHELAIAYPGADRPALEGIDLEVESGQVVLIVGPSGSGKSTLALAIAGLVPGEIPAALTGTLELDGAPIVGRSTASIAVDTGLVLQDPTSQLVMERVEDDVAFGLENRRWTRSAMVARVPTALEEVGLGGLGRRRSRRLSGGQQQRLALGGALAPRPGLLVLDEPTASLDIAGATDLMASLAALREERSTTVVLIEHQVDRAWPMADVILALDRDGRQIDVGAPDDVLARSATRMRDAGIWLPGEGSRTKLAGPGDPSDGAGATDPAVVAEGIRFGYERGEPVVRDIDLVAAAGERIALVGPNGSGKSTLGRLLVGLLRPDRGTVSLGGDAPSRRPAATLARRAGYVFQEPERQFLATTAGEEVRLGLTPEESARVDELMTRLDLPLERFSGRSPYRRSGGEQRRLSLACILIRRPKVLVLDEPTFGQDRTGYEGLLGILREHLDDGACLIAATHDQRFVGDVARRIVTMVDGWIASDETAA